MRWTGSLKHVRPGLAVIFAWHLSLAGAALAVDAPATQPAAAADGTIIAPESPQEPASRPAASLVVQGGDENAVYRGWPIRIDLQRIDAPANAPAPPLV